MSCTRCSILRTFTGRGTTHFALLGDGSPPPLHAAGERIPNDCWGYRPPLKARKFVYAPGTGQKLAFLTSGMYSKGPSSAVEAAVTLNDRPQQQIAKDCRSHHMPAWASSCPCTKNRELLYVDSPSQKCALLCTKNGQFVVRNGRSIHRPRSKLPANLFGRFA